MSDIESSRRFEYRQPRLNAGFDVEFVTGGKSFHGICQDVSETGIRAVFDDSVVTNSEGLLILSHPIGVLELHAVAAYVDQHALGFTFHFQTPLEREMTAQFISSILADQAGPPAYVLPGRPRLKKP